MMLLNCSSTWRSCFTTWVAATPAAAILKGVDGPDWALACVLMDVQVAIRTDARMGYGFCARMQWSPTEQRWLIAAGSQPAAAPSTWPGSRAAAAAFDVFACGSRRSS
mgnify:CR=1 FL=1